MRKLRFDIDGAYTCAGWVAGVLVLLLLLLVLVYYQKIIYIYIYEMTNESVRETERGCGPVEVDGELGPP